MSCVSKLTRARRRPRTRSAQIIVAPASARASAAAAMADKPASLDFYFETFKDPSDGSPYFYNEATRTTMYEVPAAPSMILPRGWQPHLSADGASRGTRVRAAPPDAADSSHSHLFFFPQARPTFSTRTRTRRRGTFRAAACGCPSPSSSTTTWTCTGRRASRRRRATVRGARAPARSRERTWSLTHPAPHRSLLLLRVARHLARALSVGAARAARRVRRRGRASRGAPAPLVRSRNAHGRGLLCVRRGRCAWRVRRAGRTR